VHSGLRPGPWKIETAIYLLKDLFYSGLTSNGTTYSMFASIEVEEENVAALKIAIYKFFISELGSKTYIN